MNPEPKIDIAQLRSAIQQARGWYGRICADTGLKRGVLRRIGNDLTYDPPLSAAAKLDAWFTQHGVPRFHPLSRAARALAAPPPK